MAGEKYRAILLKLSHDDQPDLATQLRCAKCHDPLGQTGDHTSLSPLGHGIGCESCHGGAEHWLHRHYERDMTRTERIELGMTDTKDLSVRAQQCAGCHVGSADQDMNHAMIAAGHPPLRFELSAYHDLIRDKHWNDTRDRLEQRDYQIQLWAAGQTAGAQARLELLTARCGSSIDPWPELAEFNCFACHQRIRGAAKASAGVPHGQPSWSNWNLLFAADLNADSSPQVSASLATLRKQLAPSLTSQPAEVQRDCAVAAAKFQALTANQEVTAQDAITIVLKSLEQAEDADWETRCQQYLALAAAERSYRDELARRQHFAQLLPREYNRLRTEEQSLIDELQQVRGWLLFEQGKLGDVLRDEPPFFREKQQEIGLGLQRISTRLSERISELP